MCFPGCNYLEKKTYNFINFVSFDCRSLEKIEFYFVIDFQTYLLKIKSYIKINNT